jgi:hypothetical protein
MLYTYAARGYKFYVSEDNGNTYIPISGVTSWDFHIEGLAQDTSNVDVLHWGTSMYTQRKGIIAIEGLRIVNTNTKRLDTGQRILNHAAVQTFHEAYRWIKVAQVTEDGTELGYFTVSGNVVTAEEGGNVTDMEVFDYAIIFNEMPSGYGTFDYFETPAEPRKVVEFLLITNGANPGGVWYYQENTGWQLRNNGLPSGWHWLEIQTSPFAPDTWLLRGWNGSSITHNSGFVQSDGQSVLWLTTNAGASWSPVPMTAISTTHVQTVALREPRQVSGFTSSGLIFILGDSRTAANSGSVALWRGTAAGLTPIIIVTQSNCDAYGATAGLSGDVLTHWLASNVNSIRGRGYVNAAGAYVPVNNNFSGSAFWIKRLSLNTRAFAFRRYFGADYRAFAQATGADHANGTGALDYAWTTTGREDRSIFRAGLDGVAVTAYLDPALRMKGIASDAQTMTHIAALRGGSIANQAQDHSIVWSSDGVAWQILAGPVSTNVINQASIAVIERTI